MHHNVHIFFIHSSVDGHLGCFHILVIVSNAAVNIMVHISVFELVFMFFRYSGVDFLGLVVTLFLIF